jgi:hypothetical protein
LFNDSCSIRSFIRVRPQLDADGIVLNKQPPILKASQKRGAVFVAPKLNSSGSIVLEPYIVPVDNTFIGPKDDSDTVYENIVPPLLQFSLLGASTCVVLYGATGSGKTYTMTGILRNIVQDLRGCFDSHTIQLAVVDVTSSGMSDALAKQAIQVFESETGALEVVGLESPDLSDSAVLSRIIEMVLQQRLRQAKANAKTTYVVRLTFQKKGGFSRKGEMNIVDLAGSEWGADKQLRSEIPQIASTFSALKDCLRVRCASSGAGEISVPYRTSPLTLLLRDCFMATKHTSKVALISCVAPNVSDLPLTFDSMKYVALCTTAHAPRKLPLPPAVHLMKREDALAWVVAATFGRVRTPEAVVPEGDGARLAREDQAALVERVVAMGLAPRIGAALFRAIEYVLVAHRATHFQREKERKICSPRPTTEWKGSPVPDVDQSPCTTERE